MVSGPSASSGGGGLVEISSSPVGSRPGRSYRGSYFLVMWPGRHIKRKGSGLGSPQACIQIPARPQPSQEPAGKLRQLPVRWEESHPPRGCCERSMRCVLWILLCLPVSLPQARAALPSCPLSGELASAEREPWAGGAVGMVWKPGPCLRGDQLYNSPWNSCRECPRSAPSLPHAASLPSFLLSHFSVSHCHSNSHLGFSVQGI